MRDQKIAAANEAVLSLDGAGVIWDCTPALAALFNCRREDLVAEHISVLLPELEGMRVVQDGQLSPRLSLLCAMGHGFDAIDRDGHHFTADVCVQRCGNSWTATLREKGPALTASKARPANRQHAQVAGKQLGRRRTGRRPTQKMHMGQFAGLPQS
jgi:hypothetical protein